VHLIVSVQGDAPDARLFRIERSSVAELPLAVSPGQRSSSTPRPG
jgi:hypothetical protein